MNILASDDLNNIAKKGGIELEQGLVNEPSRADIELFASLMHDRGADEPSRRGAFLAEAVGGRMGSLEQLTQDAKRGMKEVINVNDPSSIADVSRALSRYSLEMAVTTKVIGKGGQALEKLTNMQ